jgi:glycine/D-amino acid oxidase-like deaminating enzyme
MLNDPRSHGLWDRTAPPAPPTGRLTEHVAARVAIVGGGYAGVSSALHLAGRGIDAVLIEAAEIGYGGAGRNVGLVNAGMWVMPETLLEGLGPVHGERLLDLLGNGPDLVFRLIEEHGIACEPVRAGTLHCGVGASGLAELAQRAAQWQARGAPVRLLDAAEAAAKIGSDAYSGALLDLRAGTIQPLAYVRGLAQAAIVAGARLYTGSPALAVHREGHRWRVESSAGSVTADWVIAATDAYTHGLWPEIRTEQVHLPYFNFATAPLSDNLRGSILLERQGAWDTREVLSSFRFDAAGRLIFGSVGALRGTGTAIHRGWARRAIRTIFPQVGGDIGFEAEWYGQIGMTADNLPRLHELAPNIVGFSGYNGRGIAPGTVFGREMARYIAGDIACDDLPLPVTAPAPVPFRAAREAFYETGAQIVHLAANRF